MSILHEKPSQRQKGTVIFPAFERTANGSHRLSSIGEVRIHAIHVRNLCAQVVILVILVLKFLNSSSSALNSYEDFILVILSRPHDPPLSAKLLLFLITDQGGAEQVPEFVAQPKEPITFLETESAGLLCDLKMSSLSSCSAK